VVDPAAVAAPLATFDVSGQDGPQGADGRHGPSGSVTGQNGDSGTNAGPSTPGDSAGMINLELKADDAAGSVSLSGDMVLARGEKRQIRNLVVVGETGTIELLATGGQGGRGGNGGNGGNGCYGHRGSDATQYSWGSDGGRGGDGGDGGMATSGARGGDGGNIVVTLSEDDTPLLMLLHHAVKQGAGGIAGKNGIGGAGGSGGSGGSSYSWTTTSSSRNSDGTYSTHTHYHSNPGGSDGPSGSSGSNGNARVVAGANGEVGSFAIRVTDGTSSTTYESRYDLRLVSFSHENLNEDAVYEPREVVRVFDLEVENVGGMPTPKKDELSLALATGGWVKPEPGELKCRPGLPPGERFKVPGELRFRIADHTPDKPSEPLEVEESIYQRAMLPSVHRDFESYQTGDAIQQGKFVIRYPARLSAVSNLNSLAAGEATRIRFTVTNQSRFSLGTASETKRVLRVRVATSEDSELGDEHVELVIAGPGGDQVIAPQAGWTHELATLGAGEETTVELVARIKAGAPEYLRFGAIVTLELGEIDAPEKPRPIQLRGFDVRVARPFAVSDADLLLVVNHRTTREEIEAWEQVGERLAFKTAIWDLSRERHLDLEKPLSDGISLSDWFAHKAIVVLDNAIENTKSEETYPHIYLDDGQASRAVAAGIDIALIGKGVPLTRMLVPSEAADAHPEEIKRSFWIRWWAKPTEDWLAKQASKRSAELFATKPTERHIVVYRFAPEVDETTRFINTWKVGTIHTMRTLDAALGGLVCSEAKAADVHDPAYITSADVTRTLLAMFGFDENVERLRRMLARDEVSAKDLAPVIDALVVDVATELGAVVAPGWKGESSGGDIATALTRLELLARSHLTAKFDSPAGEALLSLAARIRFLAGSQVAWWEAVPPFRWMRRGPSARGNILRHLDAFLDGAFGDHNAKQTSEGVERRAAELESAWKAVKDTSMLDKRRDWAMNEAREPLASKTLTSDVEVLATWQERVLSGQEYDDIKRSRDDDAVQRSFLVAGAEAQHGELFVT
jgi:hypothetical protein